MPYKHEGKSIGQIAYEAYGDSVSWVTVGGNDMPAWPDQNLRLQVAWEAAAGEVRKAILDGQI